MPGMISAYLEVPGIIRLLHTSKHVNRAWRVAPWLPVCQRLRHVPWKRFRMIPDDYAGVHAAIRRVVVTSDDVTDSHFTCRTVSCAVKGPHLSNSMVHWARRNRYPADKLFAAAGCQRCD